MQGKEGVGKSALAAQVGGLPAPLNLMMWEAYDSLCADYKGVSTLSVNGSFVHNYHNMF